MQSTGVWPPRYSEGSFPGTRYRYMDTTWRSNTSQHGARATTTGYGQPVPISLRGPVSQLPIKCSNVTVAQPIARMSSLYYASTNKNRQQHRCDNNRELLKHCSGATPESRATMASKSSVSLLLVVHALLINGYAAEEFLMRSGEVFAPGTYGQTMELSKDDKHTYRFNATSDGEEFDTELVLEVLEGDADLTIQGPVLDPTGNITLTPEIKVCPKESPSTRLGLLSFVFASIRICHRQLFLQLSRRRTKGPQGPRSWLRP